MTTRRRAREIVLQLLYEEDLNPEQDHKVADVFLVKRLNGNRPLILFARQLFSAIGQKRREVDEAISNLARNWSIRRMAAIDRNILRMATYEILFSETPGRVAINEAIELAKRYGDKQSSQFVNGILDRLLQSQTEAASDAKTDSQQERGTGSADTAETQLQEVSRTQG